MAMGTRAKLNGREVDAFSKRARKVLKFKAGERSSVKGAFWRKMRAGWRKRAPMEPYCGDCVGPFCLCGKPHSLMNRNEG